MATRWSSAAPARPRVNPTLYQNVGYDPRKDFAPVGLIGNQRAAVLVNPNLPAAAIRS